MTVSAEATYRRACDDDEALTTVDRSTPAAAFDGNGFIDREEFNRHVDSDAGDHTLHGRAGERPPTATTILIP